MIRSLADLNIAMVIVTPVSYTHLDVYKRQLNNNGNSRETCFFPYKETELEEGDLTYGKSCISRGVFAAQKNNRIGNGLWTSGTGKRSRDRKAYRREWALWLGRGDSTPCLLYTSLCEIR